MSVPFPVTLILAADRKGGIAKHGDLPWHLPLDLARFKRLTIGNGRSAVLMGRATWDTLPPPLQPLPERLNLVLTKSDASFPGALRVASWAEALQACAAHMPAIEELWVVGGAQVYSLALAEPETTGIELTRIDADFDCDVHWSGVPDDFACVWREQHVAGDIGYIFERYQRKTASAQMP